MPKRTEPIKWHIVPLLLFSVLLVGIWLIPVVLAGGPFDVFPLLHARNFANTGLFQFTDELGRFLSSSSLGEMGVMSAADGRLSTAILAYLSQWIEWGNLFCWTVVASVTMAVALVGLWFTVFKLFDSRTAWITLVLTGLLPLYWREAIWLDNYNLAFLFLFWSFAAYVWTRKKYPIVALILCGVLYGLSVASKDVFLLFAPWFVICYAFFEKGKLEKLLKGGFIFVLCTFVVYMIPYTGDVLSHGYPINQNMARIWPGAEKIANETYLHVYPDPYTYYFEQEAFDEKYLTEFYEKPLLYQLQNQNLLLNFGIEHFSLWKAVVNGAWLSLGSMPALFQQQMIGTVLLWLFILPGIAVLWKKRRNLFIAMAGLVLSTEFIVRFVLHYVRDHLMDTGWILTIIAAVGVITVSDALSKKWKRTSSLMLSIIIVALLAVQFVQTNRVQFANAYRRNPVPEIQAQARKIAALDENVVIATPVHPSQAMSLAFLSDRTVVHFAEDTVKDLVSKRRLRKAFRTYKVTHLLGYEYGDALNMRYQLPDLKVISKSKVESQEISPFVNFLLHVIR